jgi:hypothetical protein
MKKILVVLLGLTATASTAFADLHCALGSKTPSELAISASLAYEDVQVDVSGPGVVLVQVQDNYRGQSFSFQTRWQAGEAAPRNVAGLMLGEYSSRKTSIAVTDGRLILRFDGSSYSCEDPANLRSDYSAIVASGRVQGL